jgi:hypothetical protein
MIYFIKTKITDRDTANIEKTLREYSSNGHLSLDLLGELEAIYIKDKFFYGLENETEFKITRIRRNYEIIFPRIIFLFNKNDFSLFYIRFNFVTTIFILLMPFVMAFNIYSAIISNFEEHHLIAWAIIIAGFVLLSFREYKLTLKKLIRGMDLLDNDLPF